MNFWQTWNLTRRVTILFSLVTFLVMSSLGMYLYTSARQALELRADYTLTSRVEHFRTLFHGLENIRQMKMRPALFEGMLGNEQDVRIFRRIGETAFINVNPAKMLPPVMKPVAVDKPVGLDALHDGQRADGVRVRWVAALADVGDHQDKVEIIAAYVMTQESQMLSRYLWRVIAAVSLTVALTSALAYWILRRGLLPLSVMSRQADQITPGNLSARLQVEGVPPDLHNLATACNAMLGRLEAGFQQLSQFSSDLAHELRTPVNILMGQTQVILGQTRKAEEYQALLESNLEELSGLARIIENILFLAHIDHAGFSIEREQVLLLPEMAKLADYFEGLAEERHMRFVLDVGGSADCNLLMLRRAVSNLLINAVRYGKYGTVIRLQANMDANGATVSVENQCEPIEEGQLDRMFNRFYRRDQSRHAYTESNGLGLSIVKAIMTAHGGAASVSYSTEGQTIGFHLVFPAVANQGRII